MAGRVTNEVLTLPLHAELTDGEVDRLGETLAGAVQKLE
jgi:dTDP-4-amino-4,6-dideoxygalactose transaminase